MGMIHSTKKGTFIAGIIILSSIFILSARLNAAESSPVMLQEKTTSGQATVSPDYGISGEYGTWTVTYKIGEKSIQKGGGIRVQLPDAWHAGPRNSAVRLQATDPLSDHFVRAMASRPEVKLQTVVESETKNILVKHSKPSLDGRSERYVFVVRVTVLEGILQEDDRIDVIYGDRSGGSAGFRAGAVSTQRLPVLIAIDFKGTNQFQLLKDCPQLTIRPGSAIDMLFHAPSQAIQGQPISCLISLVDKEANPVDHKATVSLRLKTGMAEFPGKVIIPPGKGYVSFPVIPTGSAPLRLVARTDDFELETVSNPVKIFQTEPANRIYWGDTHSHTHYSWDGVGRDQFNYARYISGLDFYAMTDHAIAPSGKITRGLSKQYWKEYTALTDRYNDPPHFVTLHAYECSLGKPFGHHNVFFRGAPGPLVPSTKGTLPKLFSALSKGEALTIPHHTGKFPAGIDWSIHDADLRRNIEIYSGHGLSESYNPAHPLSFENSLFTSNAKSLTSPSYVQDAWRMGVLLSALGSSDDHRAHPGQPHYGLAAVYARRLSRDAIFQALYDRQTYATTGAKIILDFSARSVHMGKQATLEPPATFTVSASGTDQIEWVELLRYQSPQKTFEVIHRWEPKTLDFEDRYMDSDYRPGAVYYVRLMQKNPIRGRAVMAWSSPIWTLKNE